MTKVALARVRVSRLLSMLEILAASRDPNVAALAASYDMLVRYESKHTNVSYGMVGDRSWKVT